MKTLSIDIETFSSVDIKDRGRHNYVESPDFEILLFGYAVDYGEPVVVDLACGESLPREVVEALFNPAVTKTAWNAMFEITCLAKYFMMSQPQMLLWVEQWRDTMVHARYCAFPGSLDEAGKAIGLPEDKRKLATGKSLIRLFSTPRKPTAKDQRTRVMPADEPEKWKLYKTYNAGDVTTEMTIEQYLSAWPVPDEIYQQWLVDVVQNERGVAVDRDLINGALHIMEEVEEQLNREAQEITGLENPNSREQIKAWVERELGENLVDLTKETVEMLLKKDLPDNVRRVLEIRQELSKAAPKKFVAMRDNMCSDGRLRGMMVFYGASRTGRWSSYTVQFQNLLRTHLEELDFARDLVKQGHSAAVRFCYGNVPDTLGQLVRTALVASPGRVFVDCDYSAIEARVIAWLSGEEWALNEFRGDGKIYEATASQMFNVPKDKIKKGNPEYELRQRGKVATLACIAKGSMVPYRNPFKSYSCEYDCDEKPIEQIVAGDLVYDGVDWVRCDGSICRGTKQVVEYQDLWATYDHMVFTQEYWPEVVPMWYAIAKQLTLYKCPEVQRYPDELCIHSEYVEVYDILNAGRHHRFTVQGVLVHNCGFGGGPAAMERMDIGHKIAKDEYPALVKQWRTANPHIVKYWYTIEEAAQTALRSGYAVTVDPTGHAPVTFRYEANEHLSFLTAQLPSGRKLFYPFPGFTENRFGKESLCYMGQNQKTGKWGVVETYSGKLVENIVQAVARDLLAGALRRLEAAGFDVVFSIHDEIVVDVPEHLENALENVSAIMATNPPWAQGLPLNAAGWVGPYFIKD